MFLVFIDFCVFQESSEEWKTPCILFCWVYDGDQYLVAHIVLWLCENPLFEYSGVLYWYPYTVYVKRNISIWILLFVYENFPLSKSYYEIWYLLLFFKVEVKGLIRSVASFLTKAQENIPIPLYMLMESIWRVL